MASTKGRGQNSSYNQSTTSVQGGASSYPTPATNTGGGRGWGDSGFIKGGTEGQKGKAGSSLEQFASIQEQKATGQEISRKQMEDALGISQGSDHSFMEHKPGDPDTLPGWSKAKDIMHKFI